MSSLDVYFSSQTKSMYDTCHKKMPDPSLNTGWAKNFFCTLVPVQSWMIFTSMSQSMSSTCQEKDWLTPVLIQVRAIYCTPYSTFTSL